MSGSGQSRPRPEGQGSRSGRPPAKGTRGGDRAAGRRPKSGPGRGGKPGRGPAKDERPPRDDRRREQRSPEQPERDTSNDLPWPEEIFELDLELEPELAKELEAFGGSTGTLSKHLLSVQVLAEADPELSYLHAARLRDRIPRAALGRHTVCIAAYRTGRFKEAIKEEAAYRRISGNFDLVPIAADSERGLERPQRALALVSEFESAELDSDTRTELMIVAGGARRDLGDDEAARVYLQKAVRAAKSPMAQARSRFALGELLAQTGQTDEARKWLQSAVEVDEDAIWTEATELLENL